MNVKMPSKAKSKHEQGNYLHPHSPLGFYIKPAVMVWICNVPHRLRMPMLGPQLMVLFQEVLETLD